MFKRKKVNLWGQENIPTSLLSYKTLVRTRYMKWVPTNLLTSCSLSDQACFLRVTAPCWAVPIVCRVPPSRPDTSTNCCVLTAGQQAYHMPESSGFSTSLLLFPYNGIPKEKLWVNLLHFQIIWLSYLCNVVSKWTIKSTDKMRITELRPFSERVPQNCERRLLSSSCLSVCLCARPSVSMDKSTPHWTDFHEIW